MSELFDEDDLVGETFNSEDKIVFDDKNSTALSDNNTLDARRRLEKVLEERRLRAELKDELDDYEDD